MRVHVRVLLAASALMAFTALGARADEWRHTIAPYIWAASLDADVTVKGNETDGSDAEFTDILDNIEFAGMLRYEGHSDRWGILVDGIYLGMGFPSATTPAEVDLDATILELAGSWHANKHWELLFGARYWNIGADIDFDILSDVSQSKSWVDGFVGFRGHAPVGKHWKWYFRGDLGAGGSDFTWNMETAFLWNPNEVFSLVLGWRVLAADFSKGSGADEFVLDATIGGPIIGAAFHF